MSRFPCSHHTTHAHEHTPHTLIFHVHTTCTHHTHTPHALHTHNTPRTHHTRHTPPYHTYIPHAYTRHTPHTPHAHIPQTHHTLIRHTHHTLYTHCTHTLHAHTHTAHARLWPRRPAGPAPPASPRRDAAGVWRCSEVGGPRTRPEHGRRRACPMHERAPLACHTGTRAHVHAPRPPSPGGRCAL